MAVESLKLDPRPHVGQRHILHYHGAYSSTCGYIGL